MSVQALAWVIQSSNSKLAARLVLFAIANHANPEGENSWPSVATIAREANLSKRQAQRALKSLCASGELWIARIGGGRRRTNTFVIEGMPRPKCWYCGTSLYSWIRTVDHQIPKSRGGKEGNNLVPCCRNCNADKLDMTVEEYRIKKGDIRFAAESETVTLQLFNDDILTETVTKQTRTMTKMSPEPFFESSFNHNSKKESIRADRERKDRIRYCERILKDNPALIPAERMRIEEIIHEAQKDENREMERSDRSVSIPDSS